MTAVAYFPAFDDAELLQQQIARACWYLAPLQPDSVALFSGQRPDRLVPQGYTPEVEAFAEEAPAWLQLRNEDPTYETLAAADVVMLWQGFDALEALGEKARERLRRAGVTLFNVDYQDRTEGSRYIDVSHRYLDNDGAVLKTSEARFRETVERLGTDGDVNLFCSGPEVARYQNYTFDGGTNVVCNSVINDDELLAAANPHVQIFGDPIFHFGCSQYAHEFRQKLTATQAQYQYTCIVPLKYYNLFTYWQPDLAEVTIAVPFDVKQEINLNLTQNYLLHTTDNILTFLMLPVASTLGRRINLLGCDGRPLEQNEYFWSHNEKTQFVGQMANIQDVHPSFFRLDYDEYYLRHCDNMEAYLAQGEAEGRQYQSLTPSYIPALRSREHCCARAEPSAPVTVAVEPNLKLAQLPAALGFYDSDATIVAGAIEVAAPPPGVELRKCFGAGRNLREATTELARQLGAWKGPIHIRQFASTAAAASQLELDFAGLDGDLKAVLHQPPRESDAEFLLRSQDGSRVQLFAASSEVQAAARERCGVELAIEIACQALAPAQPAANGAVEPAANGASDDVEIEVADLSYDIATQKLRHALETRRHRKGMDGARQRIDALTQENSTLRSELDELRALVDDMSKTLKTLGKESAGHGRTTHKLSQQQENTKAKVGQLAEVSRLAQSRASQLEQDLGKLNKAARQTARFRSNEPDYQVFDRHLTPEELESLAQIGTDVFGVATNPRAVAYMAQRIRGVEASSLGRIATSIHAAVVRALAVLSIKDRELEYVEIGVLFGINTAIVWDLLRHQFDSTRITCIDPLEGYYAADALDTLLGIPINESVLRHNLSRAQCDMEQVTILKGLSEDPDILKAAGQRSYNYLLIDGDHSYDGVKRDFENYEPFVTSGGLVIVDDYGGPEWPEVTAYADQHLMNHPGYEVLNTKHRTLVLRKR